MKKTMRRIMCVLLVCMLFASPLVSCGSSGKTLMTLGDQELSVHMYELLLSRMKGTLEYNGYPTDDEAFWEQIITSKGGTYDDYFRITILDEAKKMLAQIYLFEEVYGLSLPQNYYDDIDAYIDEALEYNFDGSKSDFNAYLANFGVNMKLLRENYVMEDKIDYLIQHISAQTTDAAREEYYNENYVCFRQILLPLYEYSYETDENGDIVYYTEGTNQICYDKSGSTKTGTDGKVVVDENGDAIYYTVDGRIAYDTENGVMMGLDEDEDGYIDFYELDEQQQKKVEEQAKKLETLIEAGDYTTFEEYGEQLSVDDVWATYPYGIFINLNKSYEVNYIDDLQESLKVMGNGDTALVRSENAYHFIMKYELPSAGYANKTNADWFENFEDELINYMIDTMCEEYIDQIVVDEDVFAEAQTMKTIGANTEY